VLYASQTQARHAGTPSRIARRRRTIGAEGLQLHRKGSGAPSALIRRRSHCEAMSPRRQLEPAGSTVVAAQKGGLVMTRVITLRRTGESLIVAMLSHFALGAEAHGELRPVATFPSCTS
jgi:hypothetical protein